MISYCIIVSVDETHSLLKNKHQSVVDTLTNSSHKMSLSFVRQVQSSPSTWCTSSRWSSTRRCRWCCHYAVPSSSSWLVSWQSSFSVGEGRKDCDTKVSWMLLLLSVFHPAQTIFSCLGLLVHILLSSYTLSLINIYFPFMFPALLLWIWIWASVILPILGPQLRAVPTVSGSGSHLCFTWANRYCAKKAKAKVQILL